jgi:flavin-dependent dehydrogenase
MKIWDAIVVGYGPRRRPYDKSPARVAILHRSCHTADSRLGAAQHRAENHRTFLVKDAGDFVASLTGEGIYGAVISGQAAATAICTNLDRNVDASETFIHLTKNLRQNRGISERAAASFYVYADRGFQTMKMRLLRSAILKSYAKEFN